MFVQTEQTPNPNTLKFIPGEKVSEIGPYEFTSEEKTENTLIKDLLSIKEINTIFLGLDFITIKKNDQTLWDEIKPKVISMINEYYLKGSVSVLDKNFNKKKIIEKEPTSEVVKKIIGILDDKVRPAVAKDGGDIKFKSLKQGVQNLLCHYVPEVKSVEAS